MLLRALLSHVMPLVRTTDKGYYSQIPTRIVLGSNLCTPSLIRYFRTVETLFFLPAPSRQLWPSELSRIVTTAGQPEETIALLVIEQTISLLVTEQTIALLVTVVVVQNRATAMHRTAPAIIIQEGRELLEEPKKRHQDVTGRGRAFPQGRRSLCLQMPHAVEMTK